METQEEKKEDQGHGQGHDKFNVIVNGRRKVVTTEYVSFDDVVNLRFDNNPPQGDNWVFTIQYRHGPKENPQGTLLRGQQVKVKDGMIFDVTATDRS